MGDSSTLMYVSQPNIYSPKKYAKNSRIVLFASYFRKLHLLVLPLLLVLTVPSLSSTYISIAYRFLRLFNGCNLSPNHVFLVLNSIIAAIAATTKLSRAKPPVERIQNLTANNPDTEVQRKVQIVHHELPQVTFRSAEQDSDISASNSKARELFREDGIEEQEQQVIPESKHNPGDGFTKRASSFRDAVEPASSSRDAANEEVFTGRMNSTESPLPHQAAPGNSLEEIWREITDKRHRHSSGRQLRESSSRVNNHAVRRAPTLSRMTRFPISSSRQEFEQPDVPELKSKSVKREPSAGVEELNRKAEEFITRFSEQMRLQKQESMIRYMRMNNTAIRS